jgi:hypothetical protein
MEFATSIISLITSIIALISGVFAVFTIKQVKNHIENVRINSPTTNIGNVYNSMVEKYDRVYNIEDWKKNSKDEYELSIPKAEHTIKNPYLIIVLRKQDNEWVEIPMVDKHIKNDGLITIVSDVVFELRVVIM